MREKPKSSTPIRYEEVPRQRNLERITVEPWDGVPPWTKGDVYSWVVYVDDEIIGDPLGEAEAAAVVRWLQVALSDLERKIVHDVEDLFMEE